MKRKLKSFQKKFFLFAIAHSLRICFFIAAAIFTTALFITAKNSTFYANLLTHLNTHSFFTNLNTHSFFTNLNTHSFYSPQLGSKNNGQLKLLHAASFPSEPSDEQLEKIIDRIFEDRSQKNSHRELTKKSRSLLQSVRALGYSIEEDKMLAVVSHYNQQGLPSRNDLMLYNTGSETTFVTVTSNKPSYRKALKQLVEEHNITISATPITELVTTKKFNSIAIGLQFFFDHRLSKNKSMALLRLDIGNSKKRYAAMVRRIAGPFAEEDKIFLHRIATSPKDIFTARVGSAPTLFVFRLHRDNGIAEKIHEFGVFITPEKIIMNENLRLLRVNDYLLSPQQKLLVYETQQIINPPFPAQTIKYLLSGQQVTTPLTTSAVNININ